MGIALTQVEEAGTVIFPMGPRMPDAWSDFLGIAHLNHQAEYPDAETELAVFRKIDDVGGRKPKRMSHFVQPVILLLDQRQRRPPP